MSCLILILIVALVPLTASAKNIKAIHGVYMHAEGIVPMAPDKPVPVVAPNPSMPPFLMGFFMDDVLQIKSITHVADATATISVILVPGERYSRGAMLANANEAMFPGGPTWGMVALDQNGDLKPGFPISVFTVALEAVMLGDGTAMVEGVPVPVHTITFSGTVVDNPVPSPFGPLVGRTAAFSAEFDTMGDTVNFKFVGGFVAGSHSTWAMDATGALRTSGYYLPN